MTARQAARIRREAILCSAVSVVFFSLIEQHPPVLQKHIGHLRPYRIRRKDFRITAGSRLVAQTHAVTACLEHVEFAADLIFDKLLDKPGRR